MDKNRKLDARVNEEVSFRIEYLAQSRSTNFFIVNVKELQRSICQLCPSSLEAGRRLTSSVPRT